METTEKQKNTISQEVWNLFYFIDFLDNNKSEYLKYIPLCDELTELLNQRSKYDEYGNYKDKLQYDAFSRPIKEKDDILKSNIYNPIECKLKELDIIHGKFPSISIGDGLAMCKLRDNFTKYDVEIILQYKKKYLDFRTETNTDFHCLSEIYYELDRKLKILFDRFKDTNENEFESFEAKTIQLTPQNKPTDTTIEAIHQRIQNVINKAEELIFNNRKKINSQQLYFTSSFTPDEQNKLFDGLINGGFLPKGTIYSHFCYVFGGTDIPKNEKLFESLLWLKDIQDLKMFIDTFFIDKKNRWKKTVFCFRDNQGKEINCNSIRNLNPSHKDNPPSEAYFKNLKKSLNK